MFYRKEDGRFPLGRTVITVHARAELSDADVNAGLERHHHGDWGELTDRDKRSNDEALARRDRLLSAYATGVKVLDHHGRRPELYDNPFPRGLLTWTSSGPHGIRRAGFSFSQRMLGLFPNRPLCY